MSDPTRPSDLHPLGEHALVEAPSPAGPATLDTFAGPVRVEWDTGSSLTPLGQAPFFIEFLKVSGRFEAWVADCPLVYKSPNAPAVRDVLGTILLAILAGHKRYVPIPLAQAVAG